MVFYESPHKILKTLNDFLIHFGSNRKVSISRELTKIYEETIRGTIHSVLQSLTEKSIRGEIVVIVEGFKVSK
jgi:16S rRNA (cytidine1402-2'-O)-methyltransferase